MRRLEDKIAIITGASAGIGKASATLFAQEGAVLGLIDINDASGEAAAEQINSTGGKARYVHADVANAEELEAAMEALAAGFGGIDVLYNNAGGATP